MKKLLLLSTLIISSFNFYGCDPAATENKATEKLPSAPEKQIVTEPVKINPEDAQLQQLEKEASRLRGGGSIKSVSLNKGKATIEYVNDYSEYKKLNPQSTVTKELLDDYWESGEAIEKALVDAPARLMRKLDFVKEVEIKLPYKGKKYSIDVKKNQLEVFTLTSLEEMKADWNKKFSDKYVYSDAGRSKFFNFFGKVE